MYDTVKYFIILLALLPTAYALGPAGEDVNALGWFTDYSWGVLTEAAGNPAVWGLALILVIALFVAIARIPSEGIVLISIPAAILISAVIPWMGLAAGMIIGAIVGIALLRIFAAR